ncbi:MAG TPA: 5-(carboxyamino)imidazole ribonucleotide synthase [Acidobacteriaceae bacterium]|nr:5-(carboxyamino)imidazole ribonucleotide synthase [Acidobacteriaceae bacterium]
MNDIPPTLLPGATIGIFGGGQLGRLTAMAARTMGYRIHVLDPDPGCPARFVVDQCVEADWTDAHEAARLARGCDVVTLEIEQISLASMRAAASFAPVRPSEQMLGVIQNRIEQKDWLLKHGFPIGEYRAVRSLDELRDAVTSLGGRCFCKSATGGYDGRGQGKVGFADDAALNGSEEQIRGAWEALGEGPGVVEQAVDLDREISVLVARSPRGEVKVYPAALNHHEQQILAWSVIPAPLTDAMAAEAKQIAKSIADTFSLEGILAVELFVTKDGRLLVNELAPRPHNSYHASERACVTSQFEQLVRAVCNLPLGETDVVQPCAIANLLGEVWLTPTTPDQPAAACAPHWDAALAVPGVRLHLYEKLRPRKGRKMGHLSAVGDTAQEAVAAVLKAKALL